MSTRHWATLVLTIFAASMLSCSKCKAEAVGFERVPFQAATEAVTANELLLRIESLTAAVRYFLPAQSVPRPCESPPASTSGLDRRATVSRVDQSVRCFRAQFNALARDMKQAATGATTGGSGLTASGQFQLKNDAFTWQWIHGYSRAYKTTLKCLKVTCNPTVLADTSQQIDDLAAGVNRLLFLPEAIPYARSPYVQRSEGFIPGRHPAMYLQHAGNYGDFPACPSCLLFGGGVDKRALCEANGCFFDDTIPFEGDPDNSGYCVEKDPDFSCLPTIFSADAPVVIRHAMSSGQPAVTISLDQDPTYAAAEFNFRGGFIRFTRRDGTQPPPPSSDPTQPPRDQTTAPPPGDTTTPPADGSTPLPPPPSDDGDGFVIAIPADGVVADIFVANPCKPCLQDAHGLVTRRGIEEATAYYRAISRGLRGEANPAIDTLPKWLKTFGFCQEETPDAECYRPAPDQTAQEFHDEQEQLVYYNQMELGFGRLLWCKMDGFRDWDVNGNPLPEDSPRGQACCVTNYGQKLYQPVPATAGVINDRFKKNNVCIMYRPGLPEHFQVQFWSFDANDQRTHHVFLDPAGSSIGGRQTPIVCTQCHGGVYTPKTRCRPFQRVGVGGAGGAFSELQIDVGGDVDCGQVRDNCDCGDRDAEGNCLTAEAGGTGGPCINTHMAADARFLPINPYSISFPDDLGADLTAALGRVLAPGETRAGQLERMRKLNCIAKLSPENADGSRPTLTRIQSLWLESLYDPEACTPGATLVADTMPSTWFEFAVAGAGDDKVDVNRVRRDLWSKVVLPGCGTCHMAVKKQPANSCGCGGHNVNPFSIGSFDEFSRYDPHDSLCHGEIAPAILNFDGGLAVSHISAGYHMPHAMPTQRWFWNRNVIRIRDTFFQSPMHAFFGAMQMLPVNPDHPRCVGFCPEPDEVWEACEPISKPVFCPAIDCPGDGDGCTTPKAEVFETIDYETSDNYCGSSYGQLGQICSTTVLSPDPLANPGRCEPGCRITHPDTGEGSNDVPYRGCGRFFECQDDGTCVACGSSAQPTCQTKQNGNDPIRPCPYTTTPDDFAAATGLCL